MTVNITIDKNGSYVVNLHHEKGDAKELIYWTCGNRSSDSPYGSLLSDDFLSWITRINPEDTDKLSLLKKKIVEQFIKEGKKDYIADYFKLAEKQDREKVSL